jgi:hypothetical protein
VLYWGIYHRHLTMPAVCARPNMFQSNCHNTILFQKHPFVGYCMTLTASSGRITDDWQIGKDLEGSSNGLIMVDEWRKTVKNITMSSVPEKIQTEHLQNTSLEQYSCTNLINKTTIYTHCIIIPHKHLLPPVTVFGSNAETTRIVLKERFSGVHTQTISFSLYFTIPQLP